MGTLRIDYHHDIVADYNYVRTSDGNDDTHSPTDKSPGANILVGCDAEKPRDFPIPPNPSEGHTS